MAMPVFELVERPELPAAVDEDAAPPEELVESIAGAVMVAVGDVVKDGAAVEVWLSVRNVEPISSRISISVVCQTIGIPSQ